MLTDQERHLIAEHNRGAFTDPDRYPQEVIHAFRGLQAFDLHAKMLYHTEEESWMQPFDANDRQNSLLLIICQVTVAKATLKNPRRRLLSVFYNTKIDQPVLSGYGYTKPQAKRWLKLIQEAATYDLL